MQQGVDGFPNLARMAFFRDRIGTHVDFARKDIRRLYARVGRVLGDVDHDGALASGSRDMKGFFDQGGDFLGVAGHETVFHDWPGNADHVGFLETVCAEHAAFHLP